MVMSTPARLPRIAALLITASASALHAQSAPETAPPAVPAPEDVVVLEKFVTEDDSFDPNNVVTKAPVSSAIGFDRKLEETPRSISVVSSELIDKIGIRDGDQLYQVVPGTFTVNRWGIAGATQQLVSQVGTTLGMNVLEAIELVARDAGSLGRSYAVAYGLGAVVTGVGLVLAFFMPGDRRTLSGAMAPA